MSYNCNKLGIEAPTLNERQYLCCGYRLFHTLSDGLYAEAKQRKERLLLFLRGLLSGMLFSLNLILALATFGSEAKNKSACVASINLGRNAEDMIYSLYTWPTSDYHCCKDERLMNGAGGDRFSF